MKHSAGRLVRGTVCAGVLACALGGMFGRGAPRLTLEARQQEEQGRVFRAGVDLIQVDAYPMRDGRVIAGLTPADFQLLEDGKPQTIQSIEFVRADMNAMVAERRDPTSQEDGNTQAADPHNRVFVIYLDTFHVSLDGSGRTRGPLVGFLDRLLGPSDLFAVTSPKVRPRDLVFVRSTKTLEDELAKYWIWGVQPVGMQAYRLEPEEQQLLLCMGWTFSDPHVPETIERWREDRVLRNLEGLVSWVESIRQARKSIVVLTRGWKLYTPNAGAISDLGNTGPWIPPLGTTPGGKFTTYPGSAPPGSATTCQGEVQRLFGLDDEDRFRRLLDTARQANVAFYPINPSGLEPPDIMKDPGVGMQDLRMKESSLKTLAENTGGIWGLRNDLDANLRAVANDVSSYYVLSYYSSNATLDGRFRKIEVKVKQPGVNVRARPGYLAAGASDSATAAGPTVAPGAVPVDTALSSLARIDSAPAVFVTGAASPSDLTIVVELSLDKSEQASWMAGGEVSVDVADVTGAKLGVVTAAMEAGVRGVLVRVPRQASQGPWRAVVRLKSKDDPLEEIATIPPDSPTGLLGAPTLWRAAVSPRAVLRPSADLQFSRTGRLRVEWPVRRPVDQRIARLLDRRGQPLAVSVTLTERTAEAGAVLDADLSLTPLSPGDYVIELTAGSGAEQERKLLAFRVVR